MNSIASALDEENFDKFKVPNTFKHYSVKVSPEVRGEQKIDWTNQPIINKRAGRPRAKDIIPNKPGVTGDAAKKAKSPLKAWQLFFTDEMIELCAKFSKATPAEGWV